MPTSLKSPSKALGDQQVAFFKYIDLPEICQFKKNTLQKHRFRLKPSKPADLRQSQESFQIFQTEFVNIMTANF